jgi:hypothetical protein
MPGFLSSIYRYLTVGMLLLASVAATGCSYSIQDRTVASKKALASSSRTVAASSERTHFRFFSPTGFWNTLVPAHARLYHRSRQMMHFFNAQVLAERRAEAGPTIVTTRWSVPIYTVPASQPTVRVTLTNGVTALQAAWKAVPLPANAHPAEGSDGHLVVWQPSTDRLWEFWKLAKISGGWQASWGGAMQNVSSNAGVYGPEAWPGANSHWGASASSLSLAGGVITLEDLERGQINHALALAIPNVRAGVYSSPAQRSDGLSANPSSLPEGAHLRLNPNLDLAALHLPRLTLMIAEAAQRYGIFVRSQAGTIDFIAQDPTPTGTEPYAGAAGYFEGQHPNQAIASFPWSDLQLLKMDLHNE